LSLFNGIMSCVVCGSKGYCGNFDCGVLLFGLDGDVSAASTALCPYVIMNLLEIFQWPLEDQ
jgi:hypothetical protein